MNKMTAAFALLCFAALAVLTAPVRADDSALLSCTSGVPVTLKWASTGATDNIQVVTLSGAVPAGTFIGGPIQCTLSSLPAAFQSNLGTQPYEYTTPVSAYGLIGSAVFAKPTGVYTVSLYPGVQGLGEGASFNPNAKFASTFTWIAA